MRILLGLQLAVIAISTQVEFSLGLSVRGASRFRRGQLFATKPCAYLAQVVADEKRLSDTAATARVNDIQQAFDCLQSVSIVKDHALSQLDAIENLAQFHTSLAYLKDPQWVELGQSVDIEAGLGVIRSKVQDDAYPSEYDFEADVGNLFFNANDAHLRWAGLLFANVAHFQRAANMALVSVSLDGGLPKIYTRDDVQQSQENSAFKPRVVSKINDEPVQDFVKSESAIYPYQDPDARYNSFFARPGVKSVEPGDFIYPRMFPGKDTKITFENGDELVEDNWAVVNTLLDWTSVVDGDSLYKEFIFRPNRFRVSPSSLPSTESLNEDEGFWDAGRERPDLAADTAPRKIWQRQIDTSNVILSDDEPGIQLGGITGLIIDTDDGPMAVMRMTHFAIKFSDRTFIEGLDKFLETCRERKANRLIIDLRGNIGGSGQKSRLAAARFIKDQNPYTALRQRSNHMARVLGASAVAKGREFKLKSGWPFNLKDVVDLSGQPFAKWSRLYMGSKANGDDFTQLFQWNPEFFPVDVPEVVFPLNRVALMSDGRCTSACAFFLDMLTLGEDRSAQKITIGGRPQTGPMTVSGGNKGGLLGISDTLDIIGIQASKRSLLRSDTAALPIEGPIEYVSAVVNFFDRMRPNDPSTPAQFIYDSSDCRIWQTPQMALSNEELWKTIDNLAFSEKAEQLKAQMCIEGSVRGDPPKGYLVTKPPYVVPPAE